MTTTIRTSIPDLITAGDSVAVTLTFPDYAAPTWSLTWALAGASVLSVTSTANSASHDLALTATQTSGLAAGHYKYRLRATDGSTVTTVETGTLTVEPDLGRMAMGEAQDDDERLLVHIKAALSNTLEGEMKMFMIAGRQVQSFEPKELLEMQSMVERRIAKKRNGGQYPAIMVGRFASRPSPWE